MVLPPFRSLGVNILGRLAALSASRSYNLHGQQQGGQQGGQQAEANRCGAALARIHCLLRLRALECTAKGIHLLSTLECAPPAIKHTPNNLPCCAEYRQCTLIEKNHNKSTITDCEIFSQWHCRQLLYLPRLPTFGTMRIVPEILLPTN